jgi:DNA-binding transcriptional ArsR family regulator
MLAEEATAMTTTVDTKIMKALAHPLRQQILMALNQRIASPSELAEELGEPLGNVSYHVRMLVDLDCIELVSTTPRRGALEHHYRATTRPVLDDKQWRRLPAATKRVLVGDVLKEIWQSVGDAADAGGFDDARAHVTRDRLTLDEKGLSDMQKLLNDTFDKAQKIKADSIGRLSKNGGEPTDTWLTIMHFGVGEDGSAAKGKKSSGRRKPASRS